MSGPVLQAKKAPLILAGVNYTYDPKTYNEKHHPAHFIHITDTANFVKHLHGKLTALKKTQERVLLTVDTETFSVSTPTDKMLSSMVRRYVKKKPQDIPFGISMSDGKQAWYITEDFGALRPLLSDPSIDKGFHNAKFDLHILDNIGLRVQGYIWDTLVLCKLIDENRKSFALKDLSLVLQPDADKWETMKDNWLRSNKVADWSHIPLELMIDYGCADAYFNHQLIEREIPRLLTEGVKEVYDEEEKVLRILYKMERVGFKTNRTYLEGLKSVFDTELIQLEQNIYNAAGGIFNANSTDQLYNVLTKKGVPDSIIPRTTKGNVSIDAKFLESIAEDYPFVEQVVNFRMTEKLRNTYVLGLLTVLDSMDRVHGNFNQTEARTGRMSASDPNLQNIPKKDKRIRKAFIPASGYILFFYDFDQIEYKLFAHYTKSPGLIAAIKRGWDVHTATAAMIFDKAYDDVTQDERSRGKTINFALIYGQGDAAFAKALKVSISDARIIKRQYFRVIPEGKDFVQQVQDVCKERGYIRNFYGRRRRLEKDEIFKAPNALIQGCAADVMKLALIRVDEYLTKNNNLSRMVSVVHDEVILEIHESEVDIVVPMIAELMADRTTFRVPITVGCEYSPVNWGAKVDYDLSKKYCEQGVVN